MNKAVLHELVLLEDEPVRDHNTDELGISGFSRVVAGAAKGTAGPFTIGIFGDWGHGKTSVLKQARSLLDEDEDSLIVTVMFNAWQFEHEDHPIVPLVATIVQAVETKIAEWKSTPQKIIKPVLEPLKAISRSLRAIAYGFSAKARIGIPGVTEIDAGFVAKEIIDRYEELGAPSDPLIGRTLYYNAFEALENASGTQHNAADGTFSPPIHKIVVFIDDLDRCLPPQALKLLESIKLVLAQRGFVFVLAVDERIIQGYLTHRYKEEFHVADYDVGPSYLDKIVQLPLPLPPHRSNFAQYINKLLDRRAMLDSSNASVRAAVTQLVDVLALGSDHNPRTLVRFINNLIVDRGLWEMKGETVDTKLLELCAVSRILRQHLDRNYYLLYRRHDVCAALSAEGGIERLRTEPNLAKDQPLQNLLARLDSKPFLKALFLTGPGKIWLSDQERRQKIEEFLAERERPLATSSLIEKAVRDSLKLAPETTLTQAHWQAIRNLNLKPYGVGDEDLYYLSNLTSLETLALNNSAVSDKGLRILASDRMTLHLLKALDLTGTKVTSACTAILSGPSSTLVNLGNLSLHEANVSDECLVHLADRQDAFPRLTDINVHLTKVTDKGVDELKAARPKLTIHR